MFFQNSSMNFYLLLLFLCLFKLNLATDITNKVFGTIKDGMVAAFGDFNSDELTDVFIIRNNFRRLEILLGSDTEPLLKSSNHFCEYENYEITSVVPGDFDGDALMDVLVTVRNSSSDTVLKIYVHWGGTTHLNCTSETSQPLLRTKNEPIAIDYNHDMIIDLYGLNHHEERCFWIFNAERKEPEMIRQPAHGDKIGNRQLSVLHSNAYLDLNQDYMADLFLQTKDKNFEIWHGNTDKDNKNTDFSFHELRELGLAGSDPILGQSIFLDMELKGVQNQILPVCLDSDCKTSKILIYEGGNFTDLHVHFKDQQGVTWGFLKPDESDPYSKVITARSGDYNMDGYPDLLITLNSLDRKQVQTFLLENVQCKVCKKPLKRSFEVQWNALEPIAGRVIAGAFYDFYQDGVLDIILMQKSDDNKYKPLAFRNTLDYDANFVKVIVLTGLTHKNDSTIITPLGRRKRTYGTNYPGPRIVYYTTTQEGDAQYGVSSQIPQSAYFSLQLPYTIFGLGRTPNFVDSLTVGFGNKSRTWTQIIPNSQMIVIPRPIKNPDGWKAQLFVTPSKLILMSVIALGGTCFVILFIILGLYIREKKEDKKERLLEANRFHFDAM